VSFGDWTKRIECVLQAGESFKAEAVDTYLLLPSFWHGMKPDERRLVVASVQKYQGYSIDCLKELQDVCSIPIKDMQHLQVCIECAKEHAEQLDRDAPDADTIVVAKSNPDIIVAALAALKGATHGLDSFLIKPPELKGMDLFKHLRYKSVTSPTAKEAPSNFLDVEVTDDQRGILKTTHETTLTRREIMKDVGEGAVKKLAARRLDNMNTIKPHSGVVNNEERLAKYVNKNEMTKSIAGIETIERAATLKKKKDSTRALIQMYGDARTKLAAKNGDVSTITKKAISAMLLAYYGMSVDESKYSKPVMIQMLSEKIQHNPESIVVPPVAAAPGAAHVDVAALATNQRPNGISDAAVAAAAIRAIPPAEKVVFINILTPVLDQTHAM
jgi:hypothetical protein